MIHTLIVDNDMLFRAGIRMMIDSSSDITVAGEATTGLEALDMIQATNVDIVLMDISIPQLNGVEATKKIVDMPNCPKILILTSYDMDEELFNALAAGATGFLLKDSPPEGLLTAISSAYNGNAVISPQFGTPHRGTSPVKPAQSPSPTDFAASLREHRRSDESDRHGPHDRRRRVSMDSPLASLRCDLDLLTGVPPHLAAGDHAPDP